MTKQTAIFSYSLKTIYRLIFLLLVSNPKANGQTFFEFTSLKTREKHDLFLLDSVIKKSLKKPLAKTTEKEWQGAFWAMQLMLYKDNFTINKLREAWSSVNERTEGFQKALIEVSYTLYPASFTKEARELLVKTTLPPVFVRAAEYLLLNTEKKVLYTIVEKKIANDFQNTDYPGISYLLERLTNPEDKKQIVLSPLFSSEFLKGETVIYSLQRKNRDVPGRAFIRGSNGKFLRNTDGSLFSIPQLARSITNYPYYITNGNTPQGIYRWTGFDTSDNNYIGPTTNLQMTMPWEGSTAVFFNNKNMSDSAWTKEKYTSLLPLALRSYEPLYESYKAGAIGRSEIIMHGTTINPDYYKGKPYFPNTPSLGCLCAPENWGKTGELLYSHQQKLVEALRRMNADKGYVVVVEIDDLSTADSCKNVEEIISRLKE